MENLYKEMRLFKYKKKMENWKKIIIEDCVTNYSVSTKGNVRNDISNRLLKGSLTNGYKCVDIIIPNKKTKTCSISRLVAQVFIENKNNYLYVNHIDGNKINNEVENLEWVTQKQNIKHAIDNNLINFHTRKIHKYDMNNNYIKSYESIKEAANELGYTYHAIVKVLKNKNKSCGGFIWVYDQPNDENIDDIENKEIVGFERYCITKDGRVFSKHSNKFLKLMLNHSGYHYITLLKDTKKTNKYIQVLVAEAFIPNYDSNKYQVNHIDGIKINNRVENLEWVSPSENTLYAHKLKQFKKL